MGAYSIELWGRNQQKTERDVEGTWRRRDMMLSTDLTDIRFVDWGKQIKPTFMIAGFRVEI